MRVLWNNLSDAATLSSSSENPNYPLEAVTTEHLSEPFRFTGKDDESITIDLGAAAALSAVGIVSNLSDGATITLKLNSSDSWDTPAVSETITAVDWPELVHFFTQASYRYARLEFADAGNEDTYIEVKRLYLGTYLQLPGAAPEVSLGRESNSTKNRTPFGQVYGVKKTILRTAAFEYPNITQDEREDINEMFASVEHIVPVWLIVWEESMDVENPLYCTIENIDITPKRQISHLFTASLSFKECK